MDRQEPTPFSNVGTYQGRSNVLGIEITAADSAANRPSAFSGSFYNTQGRQHLLTSGAGSSVAADLYIENSWTSAANGNVRSDYPIFGFTNYGGAPLHPVFDDDTTKGWIDLSAPVVYGARTSFEILYTGSSFDFPLNGNLVYSDTTISGTTGFRGSIMQAYNFGDPAQVPGSTR